MKKYRIQIYFSQWFEREVFADSPEHAENKGYKIAEDEAIEKVVDVDVIVEGEIES